MGKKKTYSDAKLENKCEIFIPPPEGKELNAQQRKEAPAAVLKKGW